MADNSQIVFDRVNSMECGACHAKIDVSSLPAFSQAVCPSCGAEITVPGRLGNYLLLSCLGSGGMGSVYRAYDETLARTVAIKVMLKSLGDAPEFLESFRREAQAAAKLNHPNIAQIYSFGQEKGQPYIVMELVGGKHFDEMIAQPKPLDQATVIKIGMEIADGLQLAAASNLIHGDIKPENILLDERDSAKLLDFGIASSPNSNSTEIWGTPYYIAPEKLKRQRVDFRSDIYCLGGTLYHALTQHPPFEGEDAMAVVKARLERAPVPMSEYRPDIDPEVAEIIDRMLQVEPAMRYPTYGSLLSDMRKYLSRVRPQSTSSVGASNKRIVIKGRGKGSGSRTSDQPSTPSTGSKHHISISRGTVDASTTSKHQSQHIQAPEGVSSQGTLGRYASEEKKKSGSKAALIAVAIVLVVLGAAGGIALHMVKKAFMESENAYSAQVEMRKASVAKLQKIVESAEKLRDVTLASYVTEADDIISKAVALVESDPEFGTKFTDRIKYVAPEPSEEEQPAAEEQAEGEKTADVKSAEAQAGEAVPAAEDNAEEASDEAVSEPAAEAVAEPVVEELPLEGMPLKAREIFEMLAPVRDAAKTADSIGEKVGAFVKSAEEEIAKVTESPTTRKDYDEAAQRVSANAKAVADLVTQANAAYDDAASSVDSLQVVIRKAKAKLDELTSESVRRASERKRLEEEAEKARVEQEKEAARVAELERIAQDKQAELNRILAAAAANLENVRAFKFDAVIRDVKRLEDQLRYPESKKALEVAVKRIECMKDLKAFLIERMKAVPFAAPNNGWKVKSASDRVVEIEFRGGKVDSMTWDKLKLAQMVPMISFYLEDEDNVKPLKLRQHVDQLRNAAIYYMTLAPENQGAQKKAAEYLQTVLTKLPSRKSEIKDLLPELKLEGME